jgi:hypothetical protein
LPLRAADLRVASHRIRGDEDQTPTRKLIVFLYRYFADVMTSFWSGALHVTVTAASFVQIF